MTSTYLYLLTIVLAAGVTALCLPLFRCTLGHFFWDVPDGNLKHHTQAVPLVGGIAILAGLATSLVFIRLTTNFPTGTLHSLRGILYGAGIIFLLGLIDDLRKPKGLSVPLKLTFQSLAIFCLMYYGVHITLWDMPALYYPLTFLWVLGITNAFNLLDISDGLCVSQALVCALGLWLIALPSERIYVNFCACALIGVCIGFWPYNHSRLRKTFLGDSGSTLLGFILAALAMGTDYSEHSNWGFLAPLLILAIPIFDTAFVSFIRLSQLKNPLRGSNDHAALRLKAVGFSSRQVLLTFFIIALCFNLMAYAVTQWEADDALLIYTFAIVLALAATVYLARIRMPK